MNGLSEEGRRALMLELRALQGISPWPGLLHLAVRLPVQVLLWFMAWHAWVGEDYAAFAAWALLAAVCFASLMSLTHDALHHRLTGIGWLDECVARLVSWPIAWPIATYKYVHLLHHRMSGSELADPERISPLARDWQQSGVQRMMLHQQLWVRMFVLGAGGLLMKLLGGLRGRLGDRVVRRALCSDGLGIVAVLSGLALVAFVSLGWRGVLGFVVLWVLHERVVGIVHQFRNHMEHYGLWGGEGAFLDTQYATARSIRTNLFGRLYFNNLNRHAEHHVAAAVPFYKLERASLLIAAAYSREGFASVETPGYFAAMREVLRQMRESFSVDEQPHSRLRKLQV